MKMTDTPKRLRKPTHPGFIFKRRILDRHELSIAQAAKFLHVSRQTLSKFCNGKCPCSLDLASRISTATGSTVALWINLQAAYDTWQAEQIEHPEVTLFPQEQIA
jgi:addiction module HigA family antidote